MNIRQPWRRGRGWLVLLALTSLGATVLTGCGALDSLSAGARSLVGADPRAARPGWKQLTLIAAADANADSALAVDVVLVKDKAVLDSLMTMPAAKYFAGRADLLRTFPEAVTVLTVEITPGQVIQLDGKRFGAERVWAALVYANYACPGEHRERLLLNNTGYVLQLQAQGFVANDIETGAAR